MKHNNTIIIKKKLNCKSFILQKHIKDNSGDSDDFNELYSMKDLNNHLDSTQKVEN